MQTSLVLINSLSQLTGCKIYGKAEFENPGGSIKDRAAKQIIEDAEFEAKLKPGGTIVEGTAGNTGIGLAVYGKPKGYKVVICMANNQAQEKVEILKTLGAEVLLYKPCPFSDLNHFYHQARKYSEENPNAFWANQFENLSNFKAHYTTTGPEIWNQTNGDIDFFVASVGTGGTMGGVSNFLKEKNSKIKTIVADPFGSGIYEYIKNGNFKTEGSSITEGIGIMRLTENFKKANVDSVIRVSDQQMIDMMYHLLKHDNLKLGTSAALNLFAVYEIAKMSENKGKTFVTMLCDHGSRYESKVYDPRWLAEKNLIPKLIH